MCCKNRPLALFGACLAIAAGTASALSSSHARDAEEATPQVAPPAEERMPELKPASAPAVKPADRFGNEQKPTRADRGKAV
jgi:hypothetical protein